MRANPRSTAHHCDCMEFMSGCADNQFGLAIVDPPYGIDINKSERLVKEKGWRYKDWDKQIPNKEYFNELKRIAKNQTIWGGNYFDLGPTRCYLVWDKKQPEDVSFASAELCWTSFDKSTKTFYWHPQYKNENRIHPTQKPVALYKWLLKNYAKQGDTILDTHMGSQSLRIACWDMGFDFVGCEIDKDYFDEGCARFEAHRKQGRLF
jgi:site-specific DNA-methyltransferase (adenine-specific)